MLGLPTTFQIPLSGQLSPVLAVVPIGLRPELYIISEIKKSPAMSPVSFYAEQYASFATELVFFKNLRN